MRKKTISVIIMLVFLFTFSLSIVKAEDAILGETLVYKYKFVEDLPTQFVKGSAIKLYEYEGEEIYDFRDYFEIYDNAETILNMHSLSGEVDLGGYEWEFDFDIDEVGIYEITLSYDGVTGYKSESIELEVVEEDLEAPEIFLLGGNFNKTRSEIPEDFIQEFNRYLRGARAYDKVDGVIEISIENFNEDDIENLKIANLGESVSLTLVIIDESGNEASETVSLRIVDLKAPNIHNAKTVTTKIGKRINYTNHLSFSDNYSEEEDITRRYKIFSTLVVKNIWEAGSRRAKPSNGNEIKNYLKLNEEGLESLVNYLTENYLTAHVLGDYYEVIDDGLISYVYIEEKEPQEGTEVSHNLWSITTDKTKATGRRIEKLEVFDLSQQELLDYVELEHESSFRVDDYYRALDLTVGARYFIYIKDTENVYRDEIETINFNKAGVSYVRVEAEDEFGNIASSFYRVVVADGLSLFEGILIINAIVLVVAIAGVVVFVAFKRRQ